MDGADTLLSAHPFFQPFYTTFPLPCLFVMEEISGEFIRRGFGSQIGSLSQAQCQALVVQLQHQLLKLLPLAWRRASNMRHQTIV